MLEIEIGEYVRTVNGTIFEFQKIDEDGFIWGSNYKGCYRTDIVKHSKNIIDLIEEGDYVNGSEVITVYGYDEDGNDKDGLGICEVDDDYAYYLYLKDIDIKSIVTKEQFEQVQYKVGD